MSSKYYAQRKVSTGPVEAIRLLYSIIHNETSLPIEVLNLADDHLLKVQHLFCDEAFAYLQKQG